jgi:hypothetical protein
MGRYADNAIAPRLSCDSTPVVAVAQSSGSADEALGCHIPLHLHHKRHTTRLSPETETAGHHRQHLLPPARTATRYRKCNFGIHPLIRLAPSRLSPCRVRKRPPTVPAARSSRTAASSAVYKIPRSQMWPDGGTPSTTVTCGGTRE